MGLTALFDHCTPFAGVEIVRYAACPDQSRDSPGGPEGDLHFAVANGRRYHAKNKLRMPVGMYERKCIGGLARCRPSRWTRRRSQ